MCWRRARGEGWTVDDRSSLLDQLRLERPAAAEHARRSWVGWLIAAVVVLVAVGAGVWWYAMPRGIPIRVATAEPAPGDVSTQAGSILDASGYVVPRRLATVSSKITGRVVELAIEEGQRVERDQVIARLDDRNAKAAATQAQAEVEQAKANLAAARAAFDNAVPTFHRNEVQFRQAFISAQDFDAAKSTYDSARAGVEVAARGVDVAEARLAVAKRNLDDTIVRAPFAGVVTVKAAQEGEMVSPVSAGGGFTRTGIGTIVDMSSLEVEVDVSESFINRVRVGQPVTVKLNAYPDWDIAGHVKPRSRFVSDSRPAIHAFCRRWARVWHFSTISRSNPVLAAHLERKRPVILVPYPHHHYLDIGQVGISFYFNIILIVIPVFMACIVR